MYQKFIIIWIITSSTSSSSSSSSLPIYITSQRPPVQTQEETQKIRKGTCCKIMPNQTCRAAHYRASQQVKEQQKLGASFIIRYIFKGCSCDKAANERLWLEDFACVSVIKIQIVYTKLHCSVHFWKLNVFVFWMLKVYSVKVMHIRVFETYYYYSINLLNIDSIKPLKYTTYYNNYNIPPHLSKEQKKEETSINWFLYYQYNK